MKRSLLYSILCLLSIALLPACGCRKGCVSIMDRCNDQMECCDTRKKCNPCDPCENIDADADVTQHDEPESRPKELADVATINQL